LKEQLRQQIDERRDKNLRPESGIMYVDNCSCQIARVSLSAIQEPGRFLPIARISTGAVLYINSPATYYNKVNQYFYINWCLISFGNKGEGKGKSTKWKNVIWRLHVNHYYKA